MIGALIARPFALVSSLQALEMEEDMELVPINVIAKPEQQLKSLSRTGDQIAATGPASPHSASDEDEAFEGDFSDDDAPAGSRRGASALGVAAPAPAGAPPPPPRRLTVLVAKTLTNSDAASGRVILPRVAVETNLVAAAARHTALAVRDAAGRRHALVLKSWANGAEHRRVWVLEQAGEALRAHSAGVGDAVGLCAGPGGELLLRVNTPEVRAAAAAGGGARFAPGRAPGGAPAGAAAAAAAARCGRSNHCAKAVGHAGFCSGPKAAAAAAAATAAPGRAAPGRAAPSAADSDAPSDTDGGRGAVGASGRSAAPRAAGYSSDETAATTLHAPGAAAAAGAAAGAALPPGAPPLARLPVGALLSKTLTAYDLSSRRVILPAAAVEAALPAARAAEALTLAAVDESGGWRLPALRAWVTVTGARGYALEGAAGFLAARRAAPGDALVAWRAAAGAPPRLEVRAGGPGGAARRPRAPDAPLTFAAAPLLLGGGAAPGVQPAFAGAATAAAAAPAACHRTAGCNKAAGHQGFCAGHGGFRRREGDVPAGAAGAAGAPRRAVAGAPRARAPTAAAADGWASDGDGDYEPPPAAKRARRGGSATPRGGPATPHGGAGGLAALLSALEAPEALLD